MQRYNDTQQVDTHLYNTDIRKPITLLLFCSFWKAFRVIATLHYSQIDEGKLFAASTPKNKRQLPLLPKHECCQCWKDILVIKYFIFGGTRSSCVLILLHPATLFWFVARHILINTFLCFYDIIPRFASAFVNINLIKKPANNRTVCSAIEKLI